MRAYRAMRDDLAIIELQDAEGCSVDLESQRQTPAELGNRAERHRPRQRSCSPIRQGFAPPHHALVRVPQPSVSEAVGLAEFGELVQVLPRQIKPDLGGGALGIAGSEQGPDLGASTVALANAHAVARTLALGIELDDDPPIRTSWLPSHRHAPAASMLFEQAYVAEVLGVQRRKVLPVEDILPHAHDAGLHLSRIARGQVQSWADAKSVAIDPSEDGNRAYVSGHWLNARQFLDHDAVCERLGQQQSPSTTRCE